MFWFGFSPADPPPSEPAVIRRIEIAGRTKIADKEGCFPFFPCSSLPSSYAFFQSLSSSGCAPGTHWFKHTTQTFVTNECRVQQHLFGIMLTAMDRSGRGLHIQIFLYIVGPIGLALAPKMCAEPSKRSQYDSQAFPSDEKHFRLFFSRISRFRVI